MDDEIWAHDQDKLRDPQRGWMRHTFQEGPRSFWRRLNTKNTRIVTPRAELELSSEEVVADYRLAFRSRVASTLLRREVLAGRAPFGASGDGKEIAQVAMARAFRPGDIRSGYYRDQTVMLATGMATMSELFAQLYGHASIDADPHSGGRQMSTEFATRFLDGFGHWKALVREKHSTSDLAPVAAQMPRSLGLAYASTLFRNSSVLSTTSEPFSDNGNEVCFATIGNGGTAEGVFWETVNAACVLQVPLVVSVWDDGYGISVPNLYQMGKGSISRILSGFRREQSSPGIDLYVVPGHDYLALRDTYAIASERARREHIPAVIHVTEMTQPLGHSSSGSHERYKSKQRLQFEADFDPIPRMRRWILENNFSTAEVLDQFEFDDRRSVDDAQETAWEACQAPLREERRQLVMRIEGLADELHAIDDQRAGASVARSTANGLRSATELSRKLLASAASQVILTSRLHVGPARAQLATWVAQYREVNDRRFNSHLYSVSSDSPLNVSEIKASYSDASELVDGRVVLLRCFDENLRNDPRIFIIGEDVGKLGDVNLVFEGLQEKHGSLRVTDTGIREATILGQGIGTALRGLRPIVDIQYVDYLLYALQIASDDLATLHHRTVGGQKAPVIIRTKGHRLQGIWHTGSPMALILSALPGVRVAVPRNMVQAAGFYNTFLRGDDPALVVEVLSGYRLKERVPDNVGRFTVPLGIPEVLRQGRDVTVVTYGALCRVALEAADALSAVGIDIEVIDAQTLNPFDFPGMISTSLKKTSALLVVDEDVPGGASAFILRHVLEVQGGFDRLDIPPRTLTATENRTPVGQDGDYFSKPNREAIIETVYGLMRERRPRDFPALLEKTR